MKTYHNQKWNFSLDYPEDWEVVLENEPILFHSYGIRHTYLPAVYVGAGCQH
jgi:hypothetical protein